jgi:hypothetical protein
LARQHKREATERERAVVEMSTGERVGDSPYPEPLERALSEEVLLIHVARAAATSWTAAAWLLERRHPERWAKQYRTSGPEPEPSDVPGEAGRLLKLVYADDDSA